MVTSTGMLFPISHFNLVDGAMSLRQDHEAQVRKELQQVGQLS